jgi:hypothetical protein
MKIRWFIYVFIGVVFGIFNFYYESYLSNTLGFGGLRTVLTYGIWLVLIMPIAIYEVRTSKSKIRSALACSLTWTFSIISYYLYMAVYNAFFMGASHRHISNLGIDPHFWENWKNFFWHSIFIRGIVEWSGYAIIGGFIIGFFISLIYLHLEKFKKVRSARNQNF